jgi:hypothetical protein
MIRQFSVGVCALLFAGFGVLSADTVYADFGTPSIDNLTLPFTFNGVNGTITAVLGPTWLTGTQALNVDNPTGATNFPSTFYSPQAPPDGLNWASLQVVGTGGGPDDIVVTFTLTFDSPVTNITLDYLNLDAAREIYIGATDASNDPVSSSTLASSLSLLSGNNLFQASTALLGTFAGDFIVNPNPAQATNDGCQDNSGGNPNGACGSVLLSGTYSSVTWEGTDVADPSGDGWKFQMSEDNGVPEPGTFWLLGLGLALSVSRIAAKRIAG